MIVFENDRFYLNDLRPFFIRLLLKKRSFLKKTIVFENTFYWQLCYNSLSIVNGGSSLAIVNEGLSLTIVNETTNFIKMVVFRKKNYMQPYWISSYTKFNSSGGVKTSWYFPKNYSIVSTDALQVGFLYSLTIVNEGVIVNDR